MASRPPDLWTPRLRLVAADAPTARAAVEDREAFARALDAEVPAEWPPETLADVQQFLAGKLAERPDLAGWWGWYVIARPGVAAERATLIGSAGCSRWGPEGLPHFGYGLLPAFFRRGYATEAARALIDWVVRQPGVERVVATTFERHIASVKILERCGFSCLGVSADDAGAPESDRQGRGRLMHFERRVPRG